MRKIYLFIIVFYSSFIVVGQQNVIDSIQRLLQNTKQDTTRLKLYLELGKACDVNDNLKYAEPAISLANKLLKQTSNEKIRKKILSRKAYGLNLIAVYYEFNPGVIIKRNT